MIVAGIGYRTAATAADLEAVVRDALCAADIEVLALLAMPGFKPATDPVPIEAAKSLGVGLARVDETALAEAAPHCPSRMSHVMPGAGTASVAEACALAAAGAGGVLLGPRMLSDRASCALARMGGAS